MNHLEINKGNRFSGLRDIFKSLSKKLNQDFKDSSVIGHAGDMGEEREKFLQTFLSSGHFPQKYSLSKKHSKVISNNGLVSLQSDIIIYDAFNCPILRDGNEHQFFPIESVYATIQVKSRLGKSDLLDAARNIASVKRLAEFKTVTRDKRFYGGAGIAIGDVNPIPLGVVFAYSLDGNSLESLKNNIEEYQKNTVPHEWINLISVLNEGIILNQNDRFAVLDSRDLIKFQSSINVVAHGDGEDSLLNFYMALIGGLGKLELLPPPLDSYIDLPISTPCGHSYKGNDFIAIKCQKHGAYEPRLTNLWIEKIASFFQNSPLLYQPSVYMAHIAGQEPPMKMEGGNIDEAMPPVYIYTEKNINPLSLIKMDFSDGKAIKKYLQFTFDNKELFIPDDFIKKDSLFEPCPNC